MIRLARVAASVALLASLLLIGISARARADTLSPFHVIASSGSVSATGWQATIQIRPATSTLVYAWAGGYLADGTFVQSGLIEPGPSNAGVAQAFVWFQTPGSSPIAVNLTDPSLSWVAFHAEQAAGVWTFWYIDSQGTRHTQLTAASTSLLGVFQVDAESWLNAWGPFPTQAMRYVQTRTGGSYGVPHLTFGPSAPICGTAEIKPTPGLNLVFRSTAGGSPCYVVLS